MWAQPRLHTQGGPKGESMQLEGFLGCQQREHAPWGPSPGMGKPRPPTHTGAMAIKHREPWELRARLGGCDRVAGVGPGSRSP